MVSICFHVIATAGGTDLRQLVEWRVPKSTRPLKVFIIGQCFLLRVQSLTRYIEPIGAELSPHSFARLATLISPKKPRRKLLPLPLTNGALKGFRIRPPHGSFKPPGIKPSIDCVASTVSRRRCNRTHTNCRPQLSSQSWIRTKSQTIVCG